MKNTGKNIETRGKISSSSDDVETHQQINVAEVGKFHFDDKIQAQFEVLKNIKNFNHLRFLS